MEKITEQEKHMLTIAKYVLQKNKDHKMPSHMSEEEAQEIVDKLEAKELKEESEKI